MINKFAVSNSIVTKFAYLPPADKKKSHLPDFKHSRNTLIWLENKVKTVAKRKDISPNNKKNLQM